MSRSYGRCIYGILRFTWFGCFQGLRSRVCYGVMEGFMGAGYQMLGGKKGSPRKGYIGHDVIYRLSSSES